MEAVKGNARFRAGGFLLGLLALADGYAGFLAHVGAGFSLEALGVRRRIAELHAAIVVKVTLRPAFAAPTGIADITGLGVRGERAKRGAIAQPDAGRLVDAILRNWIAALAGIAKPGGERVVLRQTRGADFAVRVRKASRLAGVIPAAK